MDKSVPAFSVRAAFCEHPPPTLTGCLPQIVQELIVGAEIDVEFRHSASDSCGRNDLRTPAMRIANHLSVWVYVAACRSLLIAPNHRQSKMAPPELRRWGKVYL